MNQVSVNGAVTTDPEFKTWMKGVLHDEHLKGLCVVFTKKDGTEREMQCTLVESRIPKDKQPKSETSDSKVVGQGNDDAIRVFDTEIGEWRSFRWDSIKAVNFSI
jgi:hypothetical protein